MDRVASGFGALKELVAIIMGIAVGSIVITSGELALGIKNIGPAPERPFQAPSPVGFVVLGASLVITAVRFYHGNVRAIDDDYSLNPDDPSESIVGRHGADLQEKLGRLENEAVSGRYGRLKIKIQEWKLREMIGGLVWVQAFDFLVVLIQGSTFAAFGLLLQRPKFLWCALFLLCITDLFLGAIWWFFTPGKVPRHRSIWGIISMLTITVLAAEYLFSLPYPHAIVGTLLIGSAIDYALNWGFYFPSGGVTAIASGSSVV